MKQHNYSLIELALFFTLLMAAALAALIMTADSFTWLSSQLVNDIGSIVLLWISFTTVLVLTVAMLAPRLGKWLSASISMGTTDLAEEAPADSSDSPSVPADGEAFDETFGETSTVAGIETLEHYLALRATLQWHYRTDPYQYGSDSAAPYQDPVQIVLPRYVCDKVVAWAERNDVSLSDVVERMVLNGMADEHLALIMHDAAPIPADRPMDWGEVSNERP